MCHGKGASAIGIIGGADGPRLFSWRGRESRVAPFPPLYFEPGKLEGMADAVYEQRVEDLEVKLLKEGRGTVSAVSRSSAVKVWKAVDGV